MGLLYYKVRGRGRYRRDFDILVERLAKRYWLDGADVDECGSCSTVYYAVTQDYPRPQRLEAVVSLFKSFSASQAALICSSPFRRIVHRRHF